MNPAMAVRGPKHVIKAGKTPVFERAQEMAAHKARTLPSFTTTCREGLSHDEGGEDQKNVCAPYVCQHCDAGER